MARNAQESRGMGISQKETEQQEEIFERVIDIKRVAKVVKGGRRFSFSALVIAGDLKGYVGYGFGKANEVAEAIRKGIDYARRNMIKVPVRDTTIPHEIIGHFGASKILLKPAPKGTGVIANSPLRAIFEACGIKDIVTKSLGSNNHLNMVKATFKAFTQIRKVESSE